MKDILPEEIQYGSLPEKFRAEMKAYIENGKRPGPFIQHILDGNLWEAYELSGPTPDHPSDCLLPVCGWIYGQMPDDAFKNISKVELWIAAGGMLGKRSKARQEMELFRAERAARKNNGKIIGRVLSLFSDGKNS